MGEGRGRSPCSKSFEALFGWLLGKYWNFWAYKKVTSLLSKIGRHKSYLAMSKTKGGGSRPLLDNVQKKGAFFWWLPLGNLGKGATVKYFTLYDELMIIRWLIDRFMIDFWLIIDWLIDCSNGMVLRQFWPTLLLKNDNWPNAWHRPWAGESGKSGPAGLLYWRRWVLGRNV